MEAELVARFEAIKMDCSKCPIPKQDCKWMMDTFQWENKPPGKADKWCPLIVTMGSMLVYLLPKER